MKTCRACKKEKPLDSFCKNKYQKDGINYYCIECMRAKKKKTRELVSGVRKR